MLEMMLEVGQFPKDRHHNYTLGPRNIVNKWYHVFWNDEITSKEKRDEDKNNNSEENDHENDEMTKITKIL